jgi:RNA polymerase sigma-70 factor (ECF subfamily)
MEAMTRAADPDLVGIVASAAAGDDIAFGRIVAAHHDDMRRVCAFVTRDDALADDAVQIAWSVAWRKLDSLTEPERLRAWLTRIAVNEAKRLLAKQGRRSQVELVAQMSRVTGGIDPATGIERIDALAAMDRLKPDDRALIAMRYVMGFDATELSAVVGMSPAATRQRLKRLLDRLREELE